MSDPATTELHGAVPIVPTPMRADEAIDYDALAQCVDFAAEGRLCAVCLPAYASEFYKLNEAERRTAVQTAITSARGRLLVVAQANHPSARVAAELAREYESLGAQLVSFAIPRLFPLNEPDVQDYCRTICDAISVPVLIQDFNPGGPTVGADFSRRLADECPNFRYLKLEEPLMGSKVRAIAQATEGRVGVLEGWGGMYLLELIGQGICGFMPGLGVADLLQRVWQLARDNQHDQALRLFQTILPQLVYSLQNLELFLWLEKHLLAQRGIVPESSVHVRRATWRPDPETLRHGLWLNEQLVALARQLTT